MALPPVLFTALALWFCFDLMYKRRYVALSLSCLQRLLCGFGSILCTAVAVWHCPYPVYSACCVAFLSYVQRMLCGIAPYPVHSARGVALRLSHVQRLLCGIVTILFIALAVWFRFYLLYSGCCVALPLSCLQRLFCGFASILCTALAVWHVPYPVYSACCVVLLLSHVQRLR